MAMDLNDQFKMDGYWKWKRFTGIVEDENKIHNKAGLCKWEEALN